MKILIHGDDLGKSALALQEVINKLKSQTPNLQITNFNPEENDINNWQTLINPSLFAQPKLIKITRLFTGRKTKFKDKLKKDIKDLKSSTLHLVIFEPKLINNPPRYFDQTFKFKQTNTLFNILDFIGEKKFTYLPNLLSSDQTPYELLIFMILKRLQELITWQNSKLTPKGFYQQKLKSQAHHWQPYEIFHLHHQLLNFDLAYKQGQTPYKDPKLALSLYLFAYKGGAHVS